MNRKKNYLCMEQPDTEANIEYLSFSPEEKVIINGVQVKVQLNYDRFTKQASLYIYAVDNGDNNEVLFDNLVLVSVTHNNHNEEK